jgi:glycerol uptake facilitator-like aquaporin
MAKLQASTTQHFAPNAHSRLRARSGLPWRLAAVVAVSAQIVSAICGVLLLFYWVAASIALVE